MMCETLSKLRAELDTLIDYKFLNGQTEAALSSPELIKRALELEKQMCMQH